MIHSSRSTIIILLGPPGSGKGTQATRLSQELLLPHISTGDLFRENISRLTALGQEAKKYMDTGKLVPDELVLDMLLDRVKKADCLRGYILDGFPRTIPQAEAFSKSLDLNSILHVISLSVPDSVIIERMGGRLTCRGCGAIYHLTNSPPKQKGICDNCGNELFQRPDDNEKVVQVRLQVYRDQTAPLLQYYSQQGILRSFEGNKNADDLFEELKSEVLK